MGVTIPCGRSWWKPGDIAGHCVAGHLCPNCTALRGLTAACEQAARDIERTPLYGTKEQIQGQVLIAADIAGQLRAALTAARPAAGHTEEKT